MSRGELPLNSWSSLARALLPWSIMYPLDLPMEHSHLASYSMSTLECPLFWAFYPLFHHLQGNAGISTSLNGDHCFLLACWDHPVIMPTPSCGVLVRVLNPIFQDSAPNKHFLSNVMYCLLWFNTSWVLSHGFSPSSCWFLLAQSRHSFGV